MIIKPFQKQNYNFALHAKIMAYGKYKGCWI